MIIGKHTTVSDVLLNGVSLFNSKSEQITAEVMKCDCPAKIPAYLTAVWRTYYKARHIGFSLDEPSITLGELYQLQRISTNGTEALINTLSIMLKVPENKVWRMHFISAYRYFLEIMKELGQVAEGFKSLTIPPELRIEADSAKFADLPNRGIPDLVCEFVGFMPQYKHEEVYRLSWVVVFREFQRRWRDNVNERKRLKDQELKNKQRTKR